MCIEAKLESKEGWYPVNTRECELFNTVFGKEQGRVRQIELQRFMFEYVIGNPCQSIVIGRSKVAMDMNTACVSWDEVFRQLDADSSHPFVKKLIVNNKFVR